MSLADAPPSITPPASASAENPVLPSAPASGPLSCPPAGWVCFSHQNGNALAEAIEYGQRNERRGGYPSATHAFISAGDGTVIEANGGIVISPLSNYTGQPDTNLYARCPRGWTPELGAAIVASARTQLGKPYDYSLLLGNAISDTWLSRQINRWTRDAWRTFLDRAFNRPGAFICSEFAVWSLRQQPSLAPLIQGADDSIDPQILIQMESLFAPGIYIFNRNATPCCWEVLT